MDLEVFYADETRPVQIIGWHEDKGSEHLFKAAELARQRMRQERGEHQQKCENQHNNHDNNNDDAPKNRNSIRPTTRCKGCIAAISFCFAS